MSRSSAANASRAAQQSSQRAQQATRTSSIVLVEMLRSINKVHITLNLNKHVQ